MLSSIHCEFYVPLLQFDLNSSELKNFYSIEFALFVDDPYCKTTEFSVLW